MLKFIKQLTKWYPFNKGRGRLALSKIGRTKSDQLCLEILRTGEYIYVYPNDYIGRMVSFFGDLDPYVTDFILRNIEPGDVVIDIGANLGTITLPAASIVGKEGKVIAFEPNKNVVIALEKSIEENRFINISVINKALSDKDGFMRMVIPSQSFGQAKISVDGSVNCEVMKLDNFIIDKVSPIRLVKIDVEGHEAKVLKGSLNFLKEFTPDFIVFESHQREGSFWQREETAILSKLGYSIFELKHSFLRPKLVRIPENKNYIPKTFDFVAIKRGVVYK